MQPYGHAGGGEAAAAIGRRLADRRRAMGLSLDDLAAELGLTSAELEAVEAGRAALAADRLLDAARRLDTSGAALLGEMGAGEGFLLGLDDPQVVAMLQAFAAIEARDVRAAILALVQEMAETSDFRAI